MNIPSNKLIFYFSLQEIIFENKFNNPVNNLSSSLKTIFFGTDFNNQIDNLPINLIRINFQCHNNYNCNCNCKINIFALKSQNIVTNYYQKKFIGLFGKNTNFLIVK